MEEINKSKSNKKLIASIVLLTIFLSISVFFNIYFIVEDYNNQNRTTMTYISMTTDENYICLNLQIKTNKKLVLNNVNFSILVDNKPIEAYRISDDNYLLNYTLNIYKDTNITIYYKVVNTLINPTFLYNGQVLEIGKEIHV